MNVDPGVIGGIVIALVGPIGAYIVAARRFSGKIGTSDAAQLWKESKDIRDWSTKRLEAADAEIGELRERVDHLWTRIRGLEKKNDDLIIELDSARARILELEGVA